MEILSKLSKKVPGKPREPHAPFIFTILKKCIHYKIDYALMERLNYNDLLYLVVEYDIESIEKYLQQREKERLDKRGVEIVEATPEMASQFFRKGGN